MWFIKEDFMRANQIKWMLLKGESFRMGMEEKCEKYFLTEHVSWSSPRHPKERVP